MDRRHHDRHAAAAADNIGGHPARVPCPAGGQHGPCERPHADAGNDPQTAGRVGGPGHARRGSSNGTHGSRSFPARQLISAIDPETPAHDPDTRVAQWPAADTPGRASSSISRKRRSDRSATLPARFDAASVEPGRINMHRRRTRRTRASAADRLLPGSSRRLAGTFVTFPRKRLVQIFTSRFRGNQLSCRRPGGMQAFLRAACQGRAASRGGGGQRPCSPGTGHGPAPACRPGWSEGA
jgi:hypothetical protein